MSNYHPADGKHVVVQGTKRVGDLRDSKQDAEAEAKRINEVREGQGQATQPPAQVKQNLYG